MIIFIAGMSRSGSMWTFNVTREIIRMSGKIPLPQHVPPSEKNLIREALKATVPENEVYCIKTHMLLNPNLTQAKIISTYRDVREAMVSYMKFMHCDFETGMQVAKSMMSVVDYYFDVHKNNILRIRYDRIVTDPLSIAQEINTFIGVDVPVHNIQRIVEQFSRERVKKFTESLKCVRVDNSGIILDASLRKDFETVGNFDGSFRLYDKRSAFQTNHVTGSGERWKSFLSDEQQTRLMALTKEWLVKYGFPLE